MRKFISLLLVLCLALSLGTVSAFAEGEDNQRINIEYFLGIDCINIDYNVIVDVSKGILPEELRASFSQDYVIDEANNDWAILGNVARIYLKEPEYVPVNVEYILNGESIKTARLVLLETLTELPEENRVSFDAKYLLDDNNDWKIADGSAKIYLREPEYVPVNVEYILNGESIKTARLVLLETLTELPEENRKSFDEKYLLDENNDWKILDGTAKIYLRDIEYVPVNVVYVCNGETVASVRTVLPETAKSLPEDGVHIPEGYEADGDPNLDIVNGYVTILLKKAAAEPEEVLPEEEELMDVGIVYMHEGQRVASVIIQVPAGTEKLTREQAGHPAGYTVDEKNDFGIYNYLVTLNVSKAEVSNGPKTGDESSMALWAGLMAISALSAAAFITLKKREN